MRPNRQYRVDRKHYNPRMFSTCRHCKHIGRHKITIIAEDFEPLHTYIFICATSSVQKTLYLPILFEQNIRWKSSKTGWLFINHLKTSEFCTRLPRNKNWNFWDSCQLHKIHLKTSAFSTRWPRTKNQKSRKGLIETLKCYKTSDLNAKKKGTQRLKRIGTFLNAKKYSNS